MDPDDISKIKNGLKTNNGKVIRLYAGIDADGQVKFFEINDAVDQNGTIDTTKVTIADDEYVFPETKTQD